jgi:hypothetical protein
MAEPSTIQSLPSYAAPEIRVLGGIVANTLGAPGDGFDSVNGEPVAGPGPYPTS